MKKKQIAKPWGHYETLHLEEGFQVKRIQVEPGRRLSYQKHARRSERWVIIRGEGLFVLEGKSFPVAAGSFVEIPAGALHRIQATGKSPLVFVEVQLGDYLGEDDIVRVDDDYQRTGSAL